MAMAVTVPLRPPAAPAAGGRFDLLVAYANRLPVTRVRGEWRGSAGGLVTALRPALESRRSAWVGWDGGGAEALPRHLPGLDVELAPVPIGRGEVEDYYHGFSNSTLWPLLHGLVDHVKMERRWWRAYVEVNERFARHGVALAAEAATAHWVHDYQLMLVPKELRALDPLRRIGFFLHVPFPAPELFARLPWRGQLLDGLLGADVVAFQTEEYRENFVRACARIRADVAVEGTSVLLGDGRLVRTETHPISIDAAAFAERAVAPETERCLGRLRRQFAGRRVLLGVDRLDYTKGILERLRAIELLLAERRELRGRLAFVQVAVPSRGDVREYRELRRQTEELVGRINGRFTDPGEDVPVHYLYRGIPSERLLAYYRLADVCLVTPLRDGMNLVAKEFAVVQDAGGSSGALVLSEFAGASAQLPEALPCNPFDVVGLAGAIELALELPAEERRARIERLAARVRGHDVYRWAESELGSLRGAPGAGGLR